ncbi:MAG: HAD-IA family hydrolase [Bacteroidia bacterium]|nr:HAD-IA family hydrolase [Bacteroidia bacterium]
MNVLVTCGGGFQGLTLYKELSLYSYVRSFLIDTKEENISKYFFDYFALCPPVSDKNEYKNFIFEYCRKYNINMIFPATVYDLDILSEISESLCNINCYVASPNRRFVNIFKSKKLTYEFLAHHHINTQQLLEPLTSNKYPIIGKPNYGWGSKGIITLYSRGEFLQKVNPRDVDEYIWVQYLEKFTEYSVDFSINFEGRASDAIIRSRKSVSGGFSVITEEETTPPTAINLIVKKIINLFTNHKIIGIFNIQILYISDDIIYYSDVNPRIGTSAIIHKIGQRGLVGNFLHQDDYLKNKVGESNRCNIKAVRYLSEIYIKKIKSNIEGIVFDLDDTLISNKDFIIERCKILYSQLPGLFGDYLKYLTNVSLLLNEGYAPYLIDKLCDLYTLSSIKEDILKVYRNCFPDKVTVYADVEPTLYTLKANDFKLFVLTDNPVVTQKIKWNLFPLKDIFDDVIFTDELGVSKPDSRCFSIISQNHSIAPEELIMVGDNQIRDIVGAIHAGYHSAFHIIRDDAMITSYAMAYSTVDISRIYRIMSLKEIPYYFY